MGRRDPPRLAEQRSCSQGSRLHPTHTSGSFRRCSPGSERPGASPCLPQSALEAAEAPLLLADKWPLLPWAGASPQPSPCPLCWNDS